MDAALLVQVQLEILSLSLLVASLKEEEANGSKEEQARLTAPQSVKKAAQLGISLYEQYGSTPGWHWASTTKQLASAMNE